MPTNPDATATPPVQAAALVAAAEMPPRAEVRVWGLSASERITRGLERAGVSQVSADTSSLGSDLERVVLVRSDYFYDERFPEALAKAANGTRLVVDGEPVAAVVGGQEVAGAEAWLRGEVSTKDPTCAADDLVSSYDERLRKHQPPFVARATAENVRSVENDIFAASYKGITDVVTKWVWPLPARAVVRICARRGITPNSVTALSYVLAIAVIALWAYGWFATGLVLGWVMTFLDTVDGKLARCTLTSSPLGNVLDHGLDLVHPPIWWAAWAWGLAGGEPGFGNYAITMWVIVIGYVVGRLLEGVFMLWFKMDMFTWRPFDAHFRQWIARRNPNLLLLSFGLIFAAAEDGLFAIALWTVGSIAIQIVRIAQAGREKAAGRTIRSWHEERAEHEASASA
ncbi:MAG: CDP-alcohol phosphatidyltransferase family protein [Myxococcota bacterium]|nr:CDP-alcohol phosphatidyltransferase family protein [Myxococcota bacterium]